MPDQPPDKRRHFVLRDTSEAVAFTAHGGGGPSSKDIPELPRQQHARTLQSQINALKPVAAAAARIQEEQQLESGLGLQIQFVSQPDVALAFESLANEPRKIELLSVREEGEYTFANVFVPEGRLAHFENYISEYLAEKKNRNGVAIDHRRLLDAISAIRAAEIDALWNDDRDLLPADRAEPFWWEVWLPVRGQRQKVIDDFRKLAALANCVVSENQANFPERTVLLMYASQQQFSRSVLTLNCVAELRRAKETAEFFDGMDAEEQRQWADELLGRAQFGALGDGTPRVCLLDSGVNRAHPLLDPLIQSSDMHTVVPAWGVDDSANHGTGLAGLAGYGDLGDALAGAGPVEVPHRLESVKLIVSGGANHGNAQHHAYLFSEGVARPEVAAPGRSRVFTSAVTASDYRDRGRPSSWSATVDSLAADPDDAGHHSRLFVLSAGNTDNANAWNQYPASLSTNFVHDPGQSWNAVTVGAFTHKVDTENHASLVPIASDGGLSPFTTTSMTWDSAWPLKPDVVLEGGNAAKDDLGAVGMTSLNLLTTNNEPVTRLFTTTNATSAASALCARMAAQIMAAYPNLRPETIRALIVHSAEWTDAMRTMYLPAFGVPSKRDFVHLIRHCGWGAPELGRALWSAGNSLTLVIEDQVHPYKREDGSIKSRDMNLHALPWPKDELESLQEAPVEMRVTLSYFIEPNPSARGLASKFHYPSHRLRFDVQRPLDGTTDKFVARVNAAAQREDAGDTVNPADSDWLLGSLQRHRGSLHQDVWRGTAAELASRGFIAVYPSTGWWRTRPRLERFGLPARYSFVVSIRTQQTAVDIYNAIAQKIPVAQQIVIDT